MNNPWNGAVDKALRIRQGAMNKVVGDAVGTVSQRDQAARYLHFKQNPQDLITWSAQNNGPERAIPEAARYMNEMRKRYGDND